jgi:pyruvate/2-oxoglutarate dehydrogenase complex dihydrolipoamide acyltransferase (E2) component
MHKYHIDSADVAATGPKGYILKGDVLAHIEKHKLVMGVKKEPVKAAPSKKAAPKKVVSNDPFAQTWSDIS